VFIERVAVLVAVLAVRQCRKLPRIETTTALPWLSRQNHANKAKRVTAGKNRRDALR
jgi:hypothetical protein